MEDFACDDIGNGGKRAVRGSHFFSNRSKVTGANCTILRLSRDCNLESCDLRAAMSFSRKSPLSMGSGCNLPNIDFWQLMRLALYLR